MADLWWNALASWYDYSSNAPACGGTLNDGHFYYAELGTATPAGATGYGRLADLFGLPGELPCGYGLWIRYNGKTTFARKKDRGLGDTSLAYNDPRQRRIDLYYNLADYLGFKSVGVGILQVNDGKHTPQGGGDTGGLGSVGDYDWSPQLLGAGGDMRLHGERAYGHAKQVESTVGQCAYCDLDGPHG